MNIFTTTCLYLVISCSLAGIVEVIL